MRRRCQIAASLAAPGNRPKNRATRKSFTHSSPIHVGLQLRGEGQDPALGSECRRHDGAGGNWVYGIGSPPQRRERSRPSPQ
jgi:hypothetical protein